MSNYTWCQQHQTPDTFDSAFKANQRRNLYQPWPLIKRIDQAFDQALIDCINYWFGKVWVEEDVLPFAAVFAVSFFLSSLYRYFSSYLFTHFKRTESSRWHQHSAEAPNLLMALELDIDIEPNSGSPSFNVLDLTVLVALNYLLYMNDERLIWMIAPGMLVYCYLVCSIHPILVCSRHM